MYLPSFLYQNKMIFGIRFKLVSKFCDFIEQTYFLLKGVMFLIIKEGNYIKNKFIILANESTYFKFIIREIKNCLIENLT